MRFERPAPYVVQPVVEAGDALFFTEALIHGTLTWQAKHQRRALLYKYSPGYSAWSNHGKKSGTKFDSLCFARSHSSWNQFPTPLAVDSKTMMVPCL